MIEGRHISDETWAVSQHLFKGLGVNERIDIARTELALHKSSEIQNLLAGAICILGTGAASVWLTLNEGPNWAQKGSALLAGWLVLGLILKQRETQQKKSDWEEILEREITNSRSSSILEDPELARAIYITENMRPTSSNEDTADMKRIVDYLRNQKLLADPDDVTNKELTKAHEVKNHQDYLSNLSPKTLGERINDLRNLLAGQKSRFKFYMVTAASFAGVAGALLPLEQLGVISGAWVTWVEAIYGLASGGSIITTLEQRRFKKKVEEVLQREISVFNHPTASQDETLSRAVYELDLRPSDDQLTNMKLILDTLRNQQILKDSSN